MVKSDLVEKLRAQHSDLTEREASAIVDAFFEAIQERLSAGGRVELRGFGAFSIRHRKPRVGRNPRNGDAVAVAEKGALHFKPGKAMRELLNPPPKGRVRLP